MDIVIFLLLSLFALNCNLKHLDELNLRKYVLSCHFKTSMLGVLLVAECRVFLYINKCSQGHCETDLLCLSAIASDLLNVCTSLASYLMTGGKESILWLYTIRLHKDFKFPRCTFVHNHLLWYSMLQIHTFLSSCIALMEVVSDISTILSVHP